MHLLTIKLDPKLCCLLSQLQYTLQSFFLQHSFPATLLLVLLNQTYSLVLLGSVSGMCHFYTETACSMFPLINSCSCWAIFVVSNQFQISEASQQTYFLWVEVISLTPKLQPGRPGNLVWVITFNLSGMGGPTSSYATASIALRIIWPCKPHHHTKIRILSGGFMFNP